MIVLEDVVWTQQQDPKELFTKLHRHGCVVLKDAVPKTLGKSLTEHGSNLVQSRGGHVEIKHTACPTAVQLGLQIGDLPAELYEQLVTQTVRQLMSRVFTDGWINRDIIYADLIGEETKPLLPWHQDRIQTLKMFYYPQGCSGKGSGAFEYCVGTHFEGRARLESFTAKGGKLVEFPNDIPDWHIRQQVRFDCGPRDLVVFDPDGYHRGGVLDKSRRRVSYRFDFHPVGYRDFADYPWRSGFWASSWLNLSKILRKKLSRKGSSEYKDLGRVRDVE